MTKEELLGRLAAMSAEEVAELIKEALDESGIPYTNEPGGVTFSGLDFESTVDFNIAFTMNKPEYKCDGRYNRAKLSDNHIMIDCYDTRVADAGSSTRTAAA